MLSIKQIRNRLEGYVMSGRRRFAILALGDNGMLIKNVLEDMFGIEPKYIVDNSLCKCNENVISLESFLNTAEEDVICVISVVDNSIRGIYNDALRERLPNNEIVDFTVLMMEDMEIWKDFLPLNFLPGRSNMPAISSDYPGEKIKIRILFSTIFFWNSVATVYEAFMNDERYDVKVIVGAFVADEHSYAVYDAVPDFVMWNNYRPEDDRPDVLILHMPHERTRLPGDFRKHIGLVIVAPGSLVNYQTTRKHVDDCKEFNEFYKPDYYLFDSLLYQEMRDVTGLSGSIVEMGSPKYDGIYTANVTKHIPNEWKKLTVYKNRRTVAWITTHGYRRKENTYGMRAEATVSAHIFIKTIFEYFSRHSDMNLIFRPHPLLIDELLTMDFWKKSDIERLRKYCEHSPNVVFDESKSYDAAYGMADAIISDTWCGIPISALPMLKPICMTYNSKDVPPFYPEITDNYYSAYKPAELVDFLDMVRGEHPKFEIQEEMAKKYVKHFDGKNGQRIKEFIEEKLKEKGIILS